MQGKQNNCQLAVSISLTSNQGSLPVAWRLYLPKGWVADPERRTPAGAPQEVRFATRTQIALQQLRALLDKGAPRHCVLANAGYGVDNAFRQALSDTNLLYTVVITWAVVVWPPGVRPLRPKPRSGVSRPPAVLRRTATPQPSSAKEWAMPLPPQAFQIVTWREGTNTVLSVRFAAVRVLYAGGKVGQTRLCGRSGCLSNGRLIRPNRASTLSTLPKDASTSKLVSVAHQR